jgi:hypothetical protein
MITLNLKSGANRTAHQAILTDCLRGMVPFRNSTGSLQGFVCSSGLAGRGWLTEPPYPSTPVYIVSSYDTPIAWVEQSGQWVVTKQRFSQTTGRHLSLIHI